MKAFLLLSTSPSIIRKIYCHKSKMHFALHVENAPNNILFTVCYFDMSIPLCSNLEGGWVWEGRGLYMEFQPDKLLKVIVHTSHWEDWSKPHCLNCTSIAYEDTPGTKQKHIRQCWLLSGCFPGRFADCCPTIPSSTLSSNTHVKIARPPHWHISSSMVSICGLFNGMGHLLKST